MSTSSSPSARLARDKRLRAQFNISADEWDLILKYQGGVCALCKERLTQTGKNKGKPKPLNTDHDHKTGLTRGILCTGCNRKVTEWFTFERVVALYEYFTNPPATAALGEARFGRKGRVTTRTRRKKTTTRSKRTTRKS